MNSKLEVFPKYSVLMAVYIKDNPQWFEFAIDCMLNQTVSPDDFVIVQDGLITEELEKVISDKKDKYPDLFQIILLETNKGLGVALEKGVEKCKFEFIVRMDSDDYSMPNRCEKQLRVMLEKNIDVIGCDVHEFVNTPDNIVATRVFPENHKEIYTFGKRRTPFAHPAVIMKKSQVLKVGNYQSAYLQEDFDLFVRLLAAGYTGYTIKECLVSVRVSENFYERRGGVTYLKALLAFNKKLYTCGWMGKKDFIIRSTANTVSCLVPNKLRDFIYRRFLRK